MTPQRWFELPGLTADTGANHLAYDRSGSRLLVAICCNWDDETDVSRVAVLDANSGAEDGASTPTTGPWERSRLTAPDRRRRRHRTDEGARRRRRWNAARPGGGERRAVDPCPSRPTAASSSPPAPTPSPGCGGRRTSQDMGTFDAGDGAGPGGMRRSSSTTSGSEWPKGHASGRRTFRWRRS